MININLLLEIGIEDLPHKNLNLILKLFFNNFIIKLNKYNINYFKICCFATTRRLGIKIYNLKELEKKIIKYKIFKKKIIQTINYSLNKFDNFKKMRWNNKKIFFIRPIRNIIILLNNKLINSYIFGVKSSRILYGHKFIGKKKIIIKNANDYPNILYIKCRVIANYKIRKFLIIKKSISKINKNIYIIDFDKIILNELTSLVEWPVILIGNFKKKYLNYPIELLIYIIKIYQKILPIYNYQKKIINKFILILNIKSINSKIIINDNIKLLNYRLKDINYFLKKDYKTPLEKNFKKFKKIILKKNLGTLYEKILRIQIISIILSNINKININYIIRSNLLIKCDLFKSIVYEFPNLHGIMGMYFSHYYKESEIISINLNKNNIIKKKISSLLFIIDKIDFLISFFSLNNILKNKKDPFEIRRNTLLILNIIIKKKIKLNLKNIIIKNILLYGNKIINNNIINDIINFIYKRFYFLCIKKGYSEEIIKSIKKKKFLNILNFYKILKSIKYFNNLKKFNNLINSNKRIINILNKSNKLFYKKIKFFLLKENYEIKLTYAILNLKKKIKKLIFKKKYIKILIEFIKINTIINKFFINNIIITKNKKICINRLTLLNKIKKILIKISNILIIK
ncbi:MAG: glycine--tRNA ligase subunit beta [Enterobacteriaceae bacterium PSpyr]|nr:MAG: glycine--tRNA ligase subunit beta [Enterobacteriaceae bacterium PSpyr]